MKFSRKILKREQELSLMKKEKKNGSTKNSQLNFLIMGNGKEHIATNCLCLKRKKRVIEVT